MEEDELYVAMFTAVPILILAVFLGDTPLKLASNKKAGNNQRRTKAAAAVLLWASVASLAIAAWVLGGKTPTDAIKVATGVTLGTVLGMTYVVGYAWTIGKELKELGRFDNLVVVLGFIPIFGGTIWALAPC